MCLRITALCLALIFALSAFTFGSAIADERETVRVGYYYSRDFQEGMTDDAVKRGYAYEYLQLVSEKTGWTYEYVYGDAAELYEMLLAGEIDMMTGLAYTQERAKTLLFPDTAMGVEEYSLYVLKTDAPVRKLRTVRTIGTLAYSRRSEVLDHWIAGKETQYAVREYSSLAEMYDALENGEVHAIIDADNDVQSDRKLVALEYVDESEFYICCAPGRQDLLTKLNSAQAAMFEEEPRLTTRLHEQYTGSVITNPELSSDERNYVETHRVITVGYIDDLMPFSDTGSDDQPSGAVTDIMNGIVSALRLENNLEVRYRGYGTVAEMKAALLSGEIDVSFPMCRSVWHAENENMLHSAAITDVYMSLLYSGSYTDSVTDSIAINDTQPIARTYAELYFPDSKLISCDSEESAMRAVLEGKAGSTIINSYSGVMLSELKEYSRMHLAALDNTASICFGVRKGDRALKSLLDHGIECIDSKQLQNVMLGYTETIYGYTIASYIRDNFWVVLGVFILICAMFILMACVYIHGLKKKNAQLAEANEARSVAENETLKSLHALERDELTGLYSRQAFYQRLHGFMNRAEDTAFDLWIADIKNFRVINSYYGTNRGDEMLRYFGDYLRKHFPDALLCRFGGDRFACLMVSNGNSRIESLVSTAADVAVNAPIENISIKIGMYQAVDPSLSAQVICDRAMTALRSVKGNYEKVIAAYDDPQSKIQQKAEIMESAFAAAIKAFEFVVYYQPKYDLTTLKICGAEALVRWKQKDGTIIPPNEFIPVFERDGLIRRLDEYVFSRVCNDMRSWLEAGLDPVQISVNVSRNTLRSADIAELYRGIAEEMKIPTDKLAIELTESADFTDPGIVRLVENIRTAGFKLHMDDFGAGYSSLASLYEMPFDTIKLDKSIIDTIGDRGTNELLWHITEITHFKNMSVVAEGVESEEQVKYLKLLRCDCVQGYLYSKPLSYKEFTEALRAMARAASVETDGQKENAAERDLPPAKVSQKGMTRYLTALGSIYMNMYVIDLKHDTIMEYARTAFVSDFIKRREGAAAQLKDLVGHGVAQDSLEDALAFHDLTTLRERMKDKRHLVSDFVTRRFGWCRSQFIAVSFDEENYPTEVIFTTRVVEDEKRREIELKNATRTDALTGLLNRHAFEQDCRELGEKNGFEVPYSMTVVSMDLNDLKEVNDTLGHSAGDELLRGAASCIAGSWGKIGNIYRMGGDEFLVVTVEKHWEAAQRKFEIAVENWYGVQVDHLSIATGIATVADLGTDARKDCMTQLLELADHRMYEDKKRMQEEN